MLVHKACVRCERCSGQTDYVQGLGALAEYGAKGVEHDMCVHWGARYWGPHCGQYVCRRESTCVFILILPLS